MRSRYSAYALGEIDYLVATHDPKQPPDRDAIARWAKSARFSELEIVEVEAGGPDDDVGVVEFRAKFSENGVEQEHRERSRFARIDGRWFYVDGAAPKKRIPKPGRNDPCPCGSGKKYKKCCGA
jgi:SEC-C motif-containing protein